MHYPESPKVSTYVLDMYKTVDCYQRISKNWCLLCISTSFWVLRAPKKLSKYFFELFFYLFLFILNLFQWFFVWNNKKKHWKTLKKQSTKKVQKGSNKYCQILICPLMESKLITWIIIQLIPSEYIVLYLPVTVRTKGTSLKRLSTSCT